MLVRNGIRGFDDCVEWPSTSRGFQRFSLVGVLLREIPFQRGGPFRRIRSLEGGITQPAPHTRLLVQTSTGPAQRGLRHLLTALCSTMPTTSSSSLLDEDVLVEDLKRSASMHARLERWAPTCFPS